LDTFQSLFNHIAKACNYYDTHVCLHPTSLVSIFALNIRVEYYNQNIYIFDNPFFAQINTYTANVCNSVQYMKKTVPYNYPLTYFFSKLTMPIFLRKLNFSFLHVFCRFKIRKHRLL